MGWGRDDPAFRRLFTTLFMPDATADADGVVRPAAARHDRRPRPRSSSATPRNDDEVTDTAKRVSTPTLVAARPRRRARPLRRGPPARDADPGRALRTARQPQPHPARATSPPGSAFRRELDAFLDAGEPTAPATPAALPDLSSRELAVLELVAAGLGNDGDRRAAAHQRAHGRAPPLQRLREAAPLGQGGTGGGRRPLRVCRHPAAREVGWWRRWRREPAAITSRP